MVNRNSSADNKYWPQKIVNSMIKIKKSTNTFAWSVVGIATVCVLYLIKAATEHKNIANLLLPFLGIISGASLLLFLLHKGTYIKADENSLAVTEEFINHNYILAGIERIYKLNHFYLGPTLFFNYLNENQNGVEKKLLVLGNYNKDDIKNLLVYLKTKKVRLDEYCEKLIVAKNGISGTLKP